MGKIGWNSRGLTVGELEDIVAKNFSHAWLDEYWMVLWVGRIIRNKDNDLLFEAAVVRLKEYRELTEYNFNKLDVSDCKIVNLPLRLLRILPAGTITQGGTVLFERQRQYLTNKVLRVDASSLESFHFDQWKYFSSFVKQLGRIERQVSPFKVGDSRVVIYSGKGEYDNVIFPSIELARYYWFQSTKMMQALVEPESVSGKKNKLFDPNSLKYPTEGQPYHYLWIRDEMHLKDAGKIARIAFDITAAASARSITKSVINKKYERGSETSFYLDSKFPFDGLSNMNVYGIEIMHDNMRTFLVLEIKSCSGSYPYDGLDFDKESETREVDPLLNPKGLRTIYKRDSEDELEDDFSKGPMPRFDPSFDDDLSKNGNQKNNRRINNFLVKNDASGDTSMPSRIRRVKRIKSAPPEKKTLVKYKTVTNVSPSDNKSSNDSKSTGIDIVPDHKDKEDVAPDDDNLSGLIRKIGEELRSAGAEVGYHNGQDTFGVEDLCYMYLSEEERDSLLQDYYCSIYKNGQRKRRRAIMMSVYHFDPGELLVEHAGDFTEVPDVYQNFRFHHIGQARDYIQRILDRILSI